MGPSAEISPRGEWPAIVEVVVQPAAACLDVRAPQGHRRSFHEEVADRIGMAEPFALAVLRSASRCRSLPALFDNSLGHER